MPEHYPNKFGDGATTIGWAVVAFLLVIAVVAAIIGHPWLLALAWVISAAMKARARS